MPKRGKSPIKLARDEKLQSQVTTLTTVDEEEYDQCDEPVSAMQAALESKIAPQSVTQQYDEMDRRAIHKTAEAVEKIASDVEKVANTASCNLFVLEEISKATADGYEFAAKQFADASEHAVKMGDRAKGGMFAAWAMINDLASATFSNEAEKLEHAVEIADDLAKVSKIVAHDAHQIAEATGDEDFVAVGASLKL